MDILNFLFTTSCCICSKKGEYLCSRCKKLLQRNLPECYVCRKISPNYKTHNRCKHSCSFDSVFVGWKYNKLSSKFLKKYKYKGVYNMESLLNSLIPPLIEDFKYLKNIERSIVIPVPISTGRLRDRGFNQTEAIAKILSENIGCDYSNDIIFDNSRSQEHQSLMDRDSRRVISKERFVIKDYSSLEKYENIIIVDDVITTGATLECISQYIRRECKKDISLNAFCLFRGKPFYSHDYSSVSVVPDKD